MKTRQKIYLPFKRLIDLFGSFIGSVFCLCLIWWWVFLINSFVTKGHPIFSQLRIGKNSKPFKMYKFRSLKNNANPNLSSQEAEKLNLNTRFGSFLRKSSIDETLQLINIFVGKMSFIGPRPLIDNGIDHVTIELRQKSGVDAIRPGLSGYAQIVDAKASSDKKAELDKYYFDHLGFWMDASIFIKSIF